MSDRTKKPKPFRYPREVDADELDALEAKAAKWDALCALGLLPVCKTAPNGPTDWASIAADAAKWRALDALKQKGLEWFRDLVPDAEAMRIIRKAMSEKPWDADGDVLNDVQTLVAKAACWDASEDARIIKLPIDWAEWRDSARRWRTVERAVEKMGREMTISPKYGSDDTVRIVLEDIVFYLPATRASGPTLAATVDALGEKMDKEATKC